MQKNTFSLNVLEEVDEEILNRLERMNIDKKQARKFITSNQHNTVTTTYYLLLKQKLMNGGTIVTMEMLAKQQAQQQQLSQLPAITPPIMGTPPARQQLRLNSPDNFRQMGQGVHAHQPQPANHLQQSVQQSIQYSQFNQTSHVVPTILIDSNVSGQSVPKTVVSSSPRNADPQIASPPHRISSPAQNSIRLSPISNLPNIITPVQPLMPATVDVPTRPHVHIHTDSLQSTSSTQQNIISAPQSPPITTPVQATLATSSIITVDTTSTKLTKYKVEIPNTTNVVTPTSKAKIPESRKKSKDSSEPLEQKNSSSASTPVSKVNSVQAKYAKDRPDTSDQDNPVFKDFKEHSLNEIEVLNLATKTPESGSISEIRPSAVISRQGRTSASTAKDTSNRKTATKDFGSPNYKSRLNNIYSNLKKFTTVARPAVGAPANSSRSKGDKSGSRSRERVNLMKSFDFGIEKSSGTGRKISNPSFQSTSTEDIQTKSFVGKTIDVEIRKSRSPFALDLLTDYSPKDIMKDLLSYFKKQKIITTPKVAHY